MKNLSSLLIVLLFFVLSCGPSVDGVHIRVKNVSSFDYQDVIVNTSGGEYNFGGISAGSESDYFEFDYAYSYAYVNLTIDGNTFVLQPIDYVGESILEDGYYSYEIGVANLTNQVLFIELKEE